MTEPGGAQRDILQSMEDFFESYSSFPEKVELSIPQSSANKSLRRVFPVLTSRLLPPIGERRNFVELAARLKNVHWCLMFDIT